MDNKSYVKSKRRSKKNTEDMVKRLNAFSHIITNNKQLLSTFDYIESIAPTSHPILITGETGVGKELIARAVHPLSGKKGPFVAVNAAGLDDNIFSDTLFGHMKGAFTGADSVRRGLVDQAANGTLFLDEIGDLSPISQVKLLRLLEEKEYMPLGGDKIKKTDIRIILATNKDLWLLQREGKFRKDLNFRIRTHHVHVPPLRDRLDDIPLLVNHFLEEAARVINREKPILTGQIFKLLETYPFPGNVRELKAMIFDAVGKNMSGMLTIEDFQYYIAQQSTEIEKAGNQAIEDNIPLLFSKKLPTIKQATDLLVKEALKRAKGNQSIAARILGISQQALSKRMKKGNFH